jgi:hypothetical protein
MTHELIVGYGNSHAEAVDALTARLVGAVPTRDSAALAAGSHIVRREQDPREIARKAIAYQDAERARGVSVATWQAVNAVI